MITLPDDKAQTPFQAFFADTQQAELRHLNEHLELVINNIEGGFILLDQNWRYIYANRGAGEIAQRVKGISREQLLTMTLEEAFPEIIGSHLYHELKRAMAQHSAITFEEFVEPYGTWSEYRIYPSNGYLAVFTLDITERKQAEKQLLESEENYHTVLNSIDQGFAIVQVLFDEEGKPNDYRTLTVNPSFERLTGISPEVVLSGKTIREIVPNLEDHWWQVYGNVALTGDPIRLEQGAEALGNRWYDLYAFRINAPEKRQVAVLYSEVSERKRMENALRDSEEKYRTVLNSIEIGFCVIEMAFDENEKPINYRFVEINPAFEQQTGFVNAQGKWILDLVPGLEAHWFETFGKVALTGEPTRFENRAEAMQRDYEVDAVRVGDPSQRRVALLFTDITQRKQTDRKLQESADRAAFRVALTDALRSLTDVDQIQAEACRLLGEHLRVDRAYYVEINELEQVEQVYQGYLRGDSPSLSGTYRLLDFGWTLPLFQRGETVVVQDARTSEVIPQSDLAAMETVRITSHVSVPLIKEGILRGAVCVTDSVPRDWSATEIERVQETAERLWDTIERAKTEAALRDSEEKYRTVLDSIEVGFCIIEVAFDEQEKAINYRFLEINPAFEQQTGFVNAQGKWILDLIPSLEAHWFETFGKVALTGEPTRFENRAEAMQRDYEVDAVRVGDPSQRRVALLFTDITQRKQTDRKLQESADRAAFRVALNDTLRFFADPLKMQYKASEMLANYLNANRVFYVEIVEEGEQAVIHQSYTRDLPNNVGSHSLSVYDPNVLNEHRNGRTIVVNEVVNNPRFGTDAQAALAKTRVQAIISVPLIRDGKWIALLVVHQNQPRIWTDSEVAFVEEVAERTWTAIERARVEKALRESEERYRTIFNSIDEGFSTLKLIFDDEGHVVDYWTIETNPALTKLTGLEDVAGKRISEVMPNLEREWFERLEHTHNTGESVRFEMKIRELNNWFDIYMSRVGNADQRTIVIVYNNITQRKRFEETIVLAQAQLNEERQHIVNIFESISDALVTLDFDYRFTYLNPQGAELLYKLAGTTEAQLLGSIIWESFPGSYDSEFGQAYRTAMIEKKTAQFQSFFAPVNAWFEVRVYPSKEGISIYFADITEAREHELALRTMQERLELAQEAGNVGVWDRDAITNTTYWSERMWTLYGLPNPSSPFRDDTWIQMIHPDDFQRVTDHITQTLASTQTTYRDEFCINRPDGVTRWIESIATITRDDNDKPMRMFGVNLDITDRKTTEEALRQAEERLRMIMDSAKDYAIFALDTAGLFTSWSVGAEQMMGYTEAEILGQHGRVIYTPADGEQDIPEKEMIIAAREGHAVNERWHMKKDGSLFWGSGMVTPIRDEQETLIGYTKVIRDTTDRHIAEQRTKILQQLTSNLSVQLTLPEMATTIINTIHLVVGDAMISVFLLADGNILKRLATDKVPAALQSRYSSLALDFSSAITDAVRLNEVQVIDSMETNIARYPHIKEQILENNVHSGIYIPLAFENQVLGGLSIAFNYSRPISGGDYDLTLAISNLCAIALQRAQLFEAERTARHSANLRAERILRLQNVTAKLAKALTVEQVAQAVIDEGAAALGAVTSAFNLLENENNFRVVYAVNAVTGDKSRDWLSLSPNEGLPTGHIIQKREPVWLKSKEEQIALYPAMKPMAEMYPGGWAGIPLVVEEKVVGMVGFAFLDERDFDPEERDFILVVSQLGSQALERAQLYEAEIQRQKALQIRVRLQSMISLLGQEALTHFEAIPLINRTAALLAQTLNVDYADVLEFIAKENSLILRGDVGWEEGYSENARVSATSTNYAGFTLLSKTPIVINDVEAENRFPHSPMFTHHNIVSSISVVIGDYEMPWGVLSVFSKQRRVFSSDEIYFMESVANILAASLERIRLDTMLRRSNDELQLFASVASHDLQEPLRMVASYMQLLEMRYANQLDADAREFIGFAVDGATRMKALISALLAYSRLETDDHEFEEFEAQVALDEALANLALQIEDTDALITHDVLPKIRANSVQIGQVFQNLISNALKFRGANRPEIHISVERKAHEWEFAIRDNGIGIAPDALERIFIIFQRLHKETYAGTGIGLATSKKVIERHRGRIRAESVVGKGTTFYFTIPM